MQKRLRYRDLHALGIVNNRVTLYNWIRDHGFPRGQLTGPNSRTWGEDDVRVWLASRPIEPQPPSNYRFTPGRPRKISPATAADVTSGPEAA